MTVRIAAVVFVLVLANGCSTARRELIEARTFTHVYRVPAPVLVKQLVEAVPQRKWRVSREGTNFVLLSPWARDADLAEMGSSDSQYFAVVHRVNASLSTLRITRKVQTSTNEEDVLESANYDGQTAGPWRGANVGGADENPNNWHARRTATSRDLALEWTILERIEPEAASGIKAESERVAKTRTASR